MTKNTIKIEDTNIKALTLWTRPDSWYGHEWYDHFIFLGRNRDSDVLAESNWDRVIEDLRKNFPDSEDEQWQIVREGHWACGWIEWIAIDGKANEELIEWCDEVACALSEYPVYDDEHHSEKEMEEANRVWLDCYSVKERIEYVRNHIDQFQFNSFSEMIHVVRGKYFIGYASELIY